MTPRERAAYNAGVEAVRHAAMIAAVSIEAGADSREIRHRAAAAALYGLADGARGLMLGDERGTHSVSTLGGEQGSHAVDQVRP